MKVPPQAYATALIDAVAPASKDYLVAATGPDEITDTLACSLIHDGGLLREIVYAAVYVGVHLVVQVTHHISHATRFLSRGTAVEIDQRPAVDLSPEYREILAYLFNVKHHSSSSFDLTASSRAPQRVSPAEQRPTISLTKPSICSLRASASLNPR